MTYVVAFDDSPLSQAALGRAVAFAKATNESVVAVAAIPRDSAAARERGWLSGDETFSVERVAENLTDHVTDVDPDVEFDYRVVDKYAPRGRVSREVRELAVEHDATVVFIGSDNAGRMVGGITSIGQNVSADDRYDVHIVRHVAD
ncbi:universal stress protein [Halobacterium sp. KA-6]|uniref:universal stress protein n=1 Tax=Halobacterium sp. KA-6 TaxID=2896368 RepID=UPI001E31D439|nr:universal stress protein [Halobacterium sp. KA-6]MCD2202580.1 universal stress protein [Halobacterium sp. KA-6]